MKNNRKIFFAHKSKIFEVAKNIEIHRIISRKMVIKQEKYFKKSATNI